MKLGDFIVAVNQGLIQVTATTFSHDVIGVPTVYDPADFTPKKKCRRCHRALPLTLDLNQIAPCPPVIQAMSVLPDIDLDDVRPKGEKIDTKCECGAAKALGIKRGMAGHSAWCPWSAA